MIYSAWVLYKTLNAGQWILCKKRNGRKKNLYQLNFFNHLYNLHVLMRAGIMNISQHEQNENVSPLPNKSAPLSDRLVYTHAEPDQEQLILTWHQWSTGFIQLWCQQYSSKKWSWNTVYGYIHQNCPGSLLNLQFLDVLPPSHPWFRTPGGEETARQSTHRTDSHRYSYV